MQAREQEPWPVTAVIVAAGLSRRMGAFKLTLPWRETTVVGQVAATLAALPLPEIIAVTGHRSEEVQQALLGMLVRCVHNPDYATGEMLSSIQVGLRSASAGVSAALICLGDQPQMQAATVRAVLAEGVRLGWQQVVIPSYQMRGGHPLLLPRRVWPDVLATQDSLRSLLRSHKEWVTYLDVDTSSILADLDTPEDYARAAREES